MRSTVALAALALFLSLAPRAFAGGSHGQCNGDVKTEAAAMASHGWLGLETDKNAAGAYVVKDVVAGSPAEKAGFRKGDVLVALQGVRFANADPEAMKKVKAGFLPGKQVTYTIERGGAEQQVTATLAAMPRDVLAKRIGEHVLDSHLDVAVAQN
jgi:S1-C subfamily serine protease